MCILTFITRYCERFPFILIGNRDEDLARATGGLALDTSTGLVWALDRLAGGSWMGIEPRSGRFAILTNCRRSPAAPLTCSAKARDEDQCGDSERGEPAQRAGLSTAAAMWRGAAPLSHICEHTTAVPVVALSTAPAAAKTAAEDSCCPPHGKQLQSVTLTYDPPTSRGLVIKNFLRTGILPGDADASLGSGDALVAALPAVLRVPPYYAGFNLLSCDDLRRCGVDAVTSEHGRHKSDSTSAAAPEILYTTNRYAAEHRCPVAPGQVHCLQNSYLDNMHGEPITARLGQLFTDALHRVIDPIAAEQPSSSTSGITPAMVTEVATALADECLCDRCNFDLPKMEETAFSAAEAEALHAQLHSNNPLLGFTENELHAYFGSSAVGDGDNVSVRFCDGGAAMREAYLQSSIFKVPFRGYGTRMQSMVLVEQVAAVPSTLPNVTPSASTTTVIHFCQREVSFDVATQSVVAAPWTAYRILQDGSCLRDSAEPPASQCT
ncbi:conserved hypothetical protein [Leishmania mexicana MHOM/GT/2001/U1103]|uniref:Uncharacterized protein n=1 Tax=Leishmania mexicana (strain MHOM/GT/2001/U1103) TaxID=929439 RepID=E9AML9_LEIMU|nr:conserved hypothetical protein [Leishmania mexicana MHOM/GT/2001/U1103]CBZ24174.1 conserved hypothetical protein [Leishmania mexicana MHOM/GT/2001/U1103]